MTPFSLEKSPPRLLGSLEGFSLLTYMSNSPFSGTINSHPDYMSKGEKVIDASGVLCKALKS